MTVMQNPKPYFTPELEKQTREKIRKIQCPVLIVHGDRDPLNKFNNEVFIPQWQPAGKKPELLVVPHADHGFSHSGSPSLQQPFYVASSAFFRRYLRTQPAGSAGKL
jgi:dipeptidyl aminopeptidase/acylaminoacyl peptidase